MGERKKGRTPSLEKLLQQPPKPSSGQIRVPLTSPNRRLPSTKPTVAEKFPKSYLPNQICSRKPLSYPRPPHQPKLPPATLLPPIDTQQCQLRTQPKVHCQKSSLQPKNNQKKPHQSSATATHGYPSIRPTGATASTQWPSSSATTRDRAWAQLVVVVSGNGDIFPIKTSFVGTCWPHHRPLEQPLITISPLFSLGKELSFQVVIKDRH